jgi:hypothetical protein
MSGSYENSSDTRNPNHDPASDTRNPNPNYELIDIVKSWLKVDNEIRALQQEILVRKRSKTDISVKLMSTMKDKNIEGLDINDGQLIYSRKSVKKPMTKKNLMEVLTKYYDGDFMKVNEINSFIMENRGEVIKETIVRKIAKG